MRAGLLWIAGWLMAAAACAPAAGAEPSGWWARYADPANLRPLPDGRKINLYCEGTGAPAVVFDAGLGDGASSWRGLQDEIAKTTQACVYDRAGIGLSTYDPNPRDTRAMVADLRAALKAAKVRGPYVLVGHSMAGLNVRLFASLHRREVVGLVLIDPSVENQIARMGAVTPKLDAFTKATYAHYAPCLADPRPPEAQATCLRPAPPDMPPAMAETWPQALGPGYYRAMAAELDAFTTLDSREVIAARKPFGEMPLIVLTAGRMMTPPNMTAAEVDGLKAVWTQMHDEVAALAIRGQNRIIEGATHYVHRDRPQAAISAINEVVDIARRPPKR